MYDFEKQVSMTRWPANHYDPAVKFKVKKWSSTLVDDLFSEENSRYFAIFSVTIGPKSSVIHTLSIVTSITSIPSDFLYRRNP